MSRPTRLEEVAHLLTLTADQVGALTGYSRREIYKLARTGRFPAPIDPDLSVLLWRWSRRRLEQWADGELGGAA
jgi:predicted DNA-binding transcriptional regulator AlpA